MSRKLPIAETAVQSIQFSLRHVWPAIRLGWPSFVVFLALMIAGFALLLFNIPGFPDAVLALIDEMEGLAEAVHDDALAGVSDDESERLQRTLLTVKTNLLRQLNGHRPGGRNGVGGEE